VQVQRFRRGGSAEQVLRVRYSNYVSPESLHLDLFIRIALSAPFYLHRFICTALSASFYLHRFICIVLSASFYLHRFI